MGATVDKNKYLYVADSQNNRIQIFAPFVPNIQVLQGSIVVEKDETINFNEVSLFASSVKTFTIENRGIANLELPVNGSIEVTGDNASDFALDISTLENIIAPSNSTNFNITFTPTAEGLRSAKISIHSNDPDKASIYFDVSGHGKKLEQQISFNSLPEKTVGDSPFSLNATSSSGLTISYHSSNSLVATVSGNILSIVGEGTSSITANQPGNEHYFPAIEVSQLLTVVAETPIELVPEIDNFSPSSGSIGTTVTLNGNNFQDVTEVSINGVTSKFNIISSTQITAIVPQGATSGKFYVKSVDGTAVSTSDFTVIYSKPSISNFSPSSGGAGTTVTILGTNFYGTTSVKFGNVEANVFEVKSSSTISVVVPSNAQSNFIYVTTPGGTAKSKSKFQFLKSSARPTSEKSITEQKTLLAYPNPFKGSFTLRINSSELNNLEIYIFDLQGKAMFSSSEHTTNRDISLGKDLKKGIYVVKILNGEKLQILKLIKEED